MLPLDDLIFDLQLEICTLKFHSEVIHGVSNLKIEIPRLRGAQPRERLTKFGFNTVAHMEGGINGSDHKIVSLLAENPLICDSQIF